MSRMLSGVLLSLAATLAVAAPAAAHPLGNFSVNRYARVEVGPERTTVRYVLDLAEIPTLQELQAARLTADAGEAAVRRQLLAPRAAAIADRVRLEIGDRGAAWEARDASLILPEGQAGLRTMRIALTLVASVPARAGDAVSYRDANEPGRSGWHEVVLRGVDGIDLAGSTAPASDASDELRSYPADPLVAPPDVSSARARISVAAGDAGALRDAPAVPGTPRLGVEGISEGIAGLLRAGSGGDIVATLLALVAAAGLGAAHAVTPGHGKTVMAAYLLGTRGTRRQALALGGVVALSHTVGVLALAVVALGASAVVAPERLYPTLSAVSAVIVLGIGVSLLRAQVRRRGSLAKHRHDHDHGHPHDHDHPAAAGLPNGWRVLVALGLSGGLVPSASALLLLLAAVGVRRPDLGVMLILAFGVGMAGVLVGIGLALVGASRIAARRLEAWPAAARATALLPAATAVIVLIVGAGLSVQAGQELTAAFH